MSQPEVDSTISTTPDEIDAFIDGVSESLADDFEKLRDLARKLDRPTTCLITVMPDEDEEETDNEDEE